METRSFQPLYTPSAGTGQGGVTAGVSLSVTAASQATAVFPGSTQNGQRQIMVSNQSTTVWVFVNFGVFGNIPSATLTHPAVAPGTTRVFTVDSEVTGATAIGSGAGPTTVTFVRGEGV